LGCACLNQQRFKYSLSQPQAPITQADAQVLGIAPLIVYPGDGLH